jgi:replicative DNA helicase
MDRYEEIKAFYLANIPGSKLEKKYLKAPCPFCSSNGKEKKGLFVVHLDPDSHFLGYFRCLNKCLPGGFPLYFARLLDLDPAKVPGFDPDRNPYIPDTIYPLKNLNGEIKKFRTLMGENEYTYFKSFGVSKTTVDEMRIGYNGRYLVYPYFVEDGNCYAARCVVPGKEDDSFWHGNESFFTEPFQVFNVQEIERCEGGALFIAEGESNLLTLKELGYPGIAVPSATVLEDLSQERLAYLENIFLVMNHSPEAQLSARVMAAKLGFKARILNWPSRYKRGYNLCHLAKEKGKDLRSAVSVMVKDSESFSPFSTPQKEHLRFIQTLDREKGRQLLGLPTGFEKMDRALNGIRGINIMGGQPKAGKSCFVMQITTDMAERKIPVIYYDFENGRQKIYARTLCRLSRLSDVQIRMNAPEDEVSKKLQNAHLSLKERLHFFRIVTDRKLTPDIMRRQIDFLQHETRKDHTLVVVDSLHKLPFKNLSERRTGIDEWLRHLEAIRDEQNVSFFVISELSRDEGGRYSDKPDLGSFKESGDIEYSADNAMILSPNWDPLDPFSNERRKGTLWLVASRENSPGKIAEYLLDYPFWGFKEM